MHTFKVIAIHGTFAGADSTTGTAWWQLQSDFQKHITDLVNVQWIPFRWDGGNSQIERYKAAVDLCENVNEELKGSDDDTNVVFLAHSHGGNVAAHTYRFLSHRLPGKQRFHLLTIGTPFLHRPTAMLPSFLALWKLRSYLLAHFCIGFFLVHEIRQPLLSPLSIFLSPFVLEFLIIGVHKYARPPMPTLEENFGPRLYYLTDQNRYVEEGRRLHLYSGLDEVINGLAILRRQHVDVATKKIVRRPTTVGLAICFFIFLSVFDRLKKLLPPLLRQTRPLLVGCLLAGFVITYMGVDRMVAGTINLLFEDLIKVKAFGEDTLRQVPDVKANPPDAKRYGGCWRPLPSDYDKLLEPEIDRQSLQTLKRTRMNLAGTATKPTEPALQSMIQTISFKELVHTTYFDSPALADFIAWLLVKKLGYPAGKHFDRINCERCQQWYEEIVPLEGGQSTHK